MNSNFSASDEAISQSASTEKVKKAFGINSLEHDAGYSHNGWRMTFANGCTISVQFGTGTFSDQGHSTAEVAAWNAAGNWMIWDESEWIVLHEDDSDVMSHRTPDEIALMMRNLIEFK